MPQRTLNVLQRLQQFLRAIPLTLEILIIDRKKLVEISEIRGLFQSHS